MRFERRCQPVIVETQYVVDYGHMYDRPRQSLRMKLSEKDAASVHNYTARKNAHKVSFTKDD